MMRLTSFYFQIIPIAPVAYDENNIKNKNELIHALKEKAVKFL